MGYKSKRKLDGTPGSGVLGKVDVPRRTVWGKREIEKESEKDKGGLG